MSYRPRVPRVLSGTGLGSWEETVPDTIYRNQFGWLICRSRGKANGGRIAGTRFYIIARDGLNRPRKVKTSGGSIRYFDDPIAAAFAAVKYSIEMVKAWEQSKLVSDAEALKLQVKQLSLQVEHLNKTKAGLLTYIGSLNGTKQGLTHSVKVATNALLHARKTYSTEVEERRKQEEAKFQLPSFMHKAVAHVFRQGKLH